MESKNCEQPWQYLSEHLCHWIKCAVLYEQKLNEVINYSNSINVEILRLIGALKHLMVSRMSQNNREKYLIAKLLAVMMF